MRFSDVLRSSTPHHVAFLLLVAGLSEVISLLSSFSFSPDDITYLRTLLPHCEESFFTWLGELDCRDVRLYALAEGTLCFPRIPLIRLEVKYSKSRKAGKVNSPACDVKVNDLAYYDVLAISHLLSFLSARRSIRGPWQSLSY